MSATPTKQPTLADLIKEQAKDYLNDTEIVEAIEQLPVEAKRFAPSADITDLYDLSLTTHKDFLGLSGLRGIGVWLNENKTEYFARVVTRAEEYEEYENSLARILAITASGGDMKKIKKIRHAPSGYEPMWEKPSFWRIELALNTQFPNIPTFRLNILYLFSKLDIRLFYSIDEKWPGPGDVGARTEHGEWKALHLRLRELRENPNVVSPVFTDFTNSVTEKLKKIAGIPNEPPAEQIDTPTTPEAD